MALLGSICIGGAETDTKIAEVTGKLEFYSLKCCIKVIPHSQY